MHVVNVIETRVNQLLAVVIQVRSLQQQGLTFEHSLFVIDRDTNSTLPFLKLADRLSFHCRPATPVGKNPFLNKWAFWDQAPELLHVENIALLDWDIAMVSPACWPEIQPTGVHARANPVEMYRATCLANPHLLAERAVEESGDVPTSINAGMLFASGGELHRYAQAHLRVYERIGNRHHEMPDWEREQLAASIALCEVGWNRLPDAWNVTPHSPVDDSDVIAWHYNDGHDATRRLKQSLLSTERVADCCRELQSRWNLTLKSFKDVYDDAITEPAFQPFLIT